MVTINKSKFCPFSAEPIFTYVLIFEPTRWASNIACFYERSERVKVLDYGAQGSGFEPKSFLLALCISGQGNLL